MKLKTISLFLIIFIILISCQKKSQIDKKNIGEKVSNTQDVTIEQNKSIIEKEKRKSSIQWREKEIGASETK